MTLERKLSISYRDSDLGYRVISKWFKMSIESYTDRDVFYSMMAEKNHVRFERVSGRYMSFVFDSDEDMVMFILKWS